MKALKFIVGIIVIVLLFFIFTNPSLKDFEEFLPDKENKKSFTTRSRPRNYFIYSIYHYTISEERRNGNNEKKMVEIEEGTYFGFMKNFYEKSKANYKGPAYYH